MSALYILLAEDNLVNQKVGLAMLKKAGHRVDVAANGIEAVNAVRERDYDLVLMDIHMPELDGVAATRTIRAFAGEKSRLPIIALTANAMKGDREKYLAAGMNEYVSKPIDPNDLAAAIGRVCRVETTLESVVGRNTPTTADAGAGTASEEQLSSLLDDLDQLMKRGG